MIEFLDGVAFAGLIGVSFWFVRSWLATRDRLLLGFAAGFATFAISRVLLAASQAGGDEAEPAIYLLRAVGFALIIAAVIDRNRTGSG